MLRTVWDAIPTQQALGNFSSSGTFICPLEENMLLLVTSTRKQISTQAATKFMNSSDKCFIMARKCLTPTVLTRIFSTSMKFEILIISNLHLKVLLSQK